MVRPALSIAIALALGCATPGCFFVKTFDGRKECGKQFDVRCEGDVAVNCVRSCGQYCDEFIDRQTCSQGCEIVNYDGPNDPPDLGTPVPYTETRAKCIGTDAGADASDDAGRADADTASEQ